MAAKTTPRGAETDERGGCDKARKDVSVKKRRRPLLGLGIVLILLLVSKIIISGAYLNLWPVKLGRTSLALAKNADPSKSDQATAQQSTGLTSEMLEKKARELKEKELELQKREEELLPLKTEIEEKLAELNDLQLRLTAYAKKLADRERALEDSKMGHLVALYSAMEPAKAAAIMDKLKIPTVVLILRHMKGKSAGQVLAMMNPERGAVISEKLTHLD